MPQYSFQCRRCKIYFKQSLPFDADLSQVTCPNGHLQIERVYSPPPIIFKGKGYYITDNHKVGHQVNK